MPYSDKYKCIFIHIPKTGGSSLESRLKLWDKKTAKYNGLAGPIDQGILHLTDSNTFFYQHLKYKDIVKLLPFDVISSYFTITVVRNPFDRLVSIFSYKDATLRDYMETLGFKLSSMSFGSFCECLPDLRHCHVDPQVSFLEKPDNSLFFPDFIGRFEKYSEDNKKLSEILGIPHAEYKYNTSQHGFYRDYYTDSTKRIVAKFYERDLDVFKYVF